MCGLVAEEAGYVGVSVDDPQGLGEGGADWLSLALIDARNHTLRLLDAIVAAHAQQTAPAATASGTAARPQAAPAGAVCSAPAPPPHPAPAAAPAQAQHAIWQAGRLGWWAERWIARNTQRALGAAGPSHPTRLASVEPQADAWWQLAPLHVPGLAAQQGAHGPDLAHTKAYLLETLETTLGLLEKVADHDAAGLYFFRQALVREDEAAYALWCHAQQAGLPLDAPALAAPAASRAPNRLHLPARRVSVGDSPALAERPGVGPTFACDLAQPAHMVALPDFDIDAQPVSWAAYAEFVADGGYDEPRWWTEAGWRWLQLGSEHVRRVPQHVEQIARGAVVVQRLGRTVRVSGHAPACHVSAHEAHAWCQWAGRHLPTEAQWECAARHAQRLGFVWGEVLEWTAERIQPYPNAPVAPWRIEDPVPWAQAVVLRGQSWAHSQRLRQASWRRWAAADDIIGLTGFRSCGWG
jgi:gamma-glutamyl hercynylcysteine S-oxide synthase